MTKINAEKKGRKQTSGPAGSREANTLRHLSIPTLTSLNVVSLLCLPRREGQERG